MLILAVASTALAWRQLIIATLPIKPFLWRIYLLMQGYLMSTMPYWFTWVRMFDVSVLFASSAASTTFVASILTLLAKLVNIGLSVLTPLVSLPVSGVVIKEKGLHNWTSTTWTSLLTE